MDSQNLRLLFILGEYELHFNRKYFPHLYTLFKILHPVLKYYCKRVLYFTLFLESCTLFYSGTQSISICTELGIVKFISKPPVSLSLAKRQLYHPKILQLSLRILIRIFQLLLANFAD